MTRIIFKKRDDSTLKEIQNCSLAMLEFFDTFAKENHLTYYLSGGTLLGAIRHKGFIPWDDDVDLMMPRGDYERLIELFGNERYKISCCEKDEDYITPYARVWDSMTTVKFQSVNNKQIGVFLDIFPIDGFPAGKYRTMLHLLRIKFLNVKLNCSARRAFVENEKYVPIKKILGLFVKKNGNYYARKLSCLAKKYDYASCAYVGVNTSPIHLSREKNSKDGYAETIEVPFEHLMLPAPVGYDVYLKQLYGDYMQLPPEEKRYSIHTFEVEFYTNFQ